MRLDNCYIWGDNVIEDGSTLDRAVLAHEVVVRRGAKVEHGAILSFKVCSDVVVSTV